MLPPRPVLLLCLLAALLASWVAFVPLGGVPHTPDDIDYTLQARLFADGLRVGPSLRWPVLSSYALLLTTPGIAAAFPPGWPALLSLGERFGAGVLVNPLLAGLLPWGLWRLAQALTGDTRAAGLAAAVAALSPGVLALAGSRMAHTGVLVALVFVAGRAAERRLGLLAGLALGYVAVARPMDAVCAGLPLLLLGGTPNRKGLLRMAPPLLLAAAWLLWDNHRFTGELLQHPASAWFAHEYPERPGCNRLGFGPELGCYPTHGSFGHTLAKAWTNLKSNAVLFDRLLLGVPGGGLLALGGVLRLARRRPALLLPLLAVPLLHAAYWMPGLAYGARFWHPLYALAPVGLGVMLAAIPGVLPWLAATGLPLLGLVPVASALGQSYWCVDASVRDGLVSRGIDRGTVFVRMVGKRSGSWPALGMTGMVCNPPTAIGSAWLLMDPRPDAALHIVHLPSETDGPKIVLDAQGGGAPAWVLLGHVPTGEWRIAALDPATGRPGAFEPL